MWTVRRSGALQREDSSLREFQRNPSGWKDDDTLSCRKSFATWPCDMRCERHMCGDYSNLVSRMTMQKSRLNQNESPLGPEREWVHWMCLEERNFLKIVQKMLKIQISNCLTNRKSWVTSERNSTHHFVMIFNLNVRVCKQSTFVQRLSKHNCWFSMSALEFFGKWVHFELSTDSAVRLKSAFRGDLFVGEGALKNCCKCCYFVTSKVSEELGVSSGVRDEIGWRKSRSQSNLVHARITGDRWSIRTIFRIQTFKQRSSHV